MDVPCGDPFELACLKPVSDVIAMIVRGVLEPRPQPHPGLLWQFTHR